MPWMTPMLTRAAQIFVFACLLFAAPPGQAQAPGSAFNWSTNPDNNGTIDPSIKANDNSAARNYMPALRGVMSGTAKALSTRGQPNGIATLGPDGKLPAGQLGAVQITAPLTLPLTVVSPTATAPSITASPSGACDQLNGHFVQNWNTNNYFPDCSGVFVGDQLSYAASRGANSIAGVTPKTLDRGHVENTRMLIQHATPGTTNEGMLVVNHTNTKGQRGTPHAAPGGADWATTPIGITQFVSPDENGVDFPSKVWMFNADVWYAPNSGKILQVGAEWDYNNYNNSCGYDVADRTGCYQIGQWHQYNSAISRDYDMRVSPVVGPAYFGHATVSGNTLTAIDWELTQTGNPGPFSKGMFHVWLYPGAGVQSGPGTFYRVASCTDTKVCTLEAPPPSGTYGFQHNPTQISFGWQMDLGGDGTAADGRILHPNLVGEANIRLLDNAFQGIVIGGRQKNGINTSSALGMAYSLLTAPGQSIGLNGGSNTLRYDSSVLGMTYGTTPTSPIMTVYDAGVLYVNGYYRDTIINFSQLPACTNGNAGDRITIRDAATTGFYTAANGGGANVVRVGCTGAAGGWKIGG